MPEVGPFVDATVEMRSAVASSGNAVEAALRQMPGDQNYADNFARQWSTRVQAVDTLVDYAESLHAIVQAGQTGGQAVGALANAVTSLAKGVGVVMPAAGIVSVATDTATFIYSQIALIRAAKSLQEALVHTQPAVERMASIIALDLKNADDILQAALLNLLQQRQIDYQVELGFRNGLMLEQKALYAQGPQALTVQEKARLLEINQFLKSTDTWYAPLQAEQEQRTKQLRTGRALIALTVALIG